MIIVCSWCNGVIRVSENEQPPENGGYPVSYGICGLCQVMEYLKLDIPLERCFMEATAPLLAVDETQRIKLISDSACELLGTTAVDAVGNLIGRLFQCPRARHSGGCATGLVCRDCRLFNVLQDARITRRRLDRVPASLPQFSEENAPVGELTISALYLAGYTVLQFDRILPRKPGTSARS